MTRGSTWRSVSRAHAASRVSESHHRTGPESFGVSGPQQLSAVNNTCQISFSAIPKMEQQGMTTSTAAAARAHRSTLRCLETATSQIQGCALLIAGSRLSLDRARPILPHHLTYQGLGGVASASRVPTTTTTNSTIRGRDLHQPPGNSLWRSGPRQLRAAGWHLDIQMEGFLW